jgi:hypothetical protein
LRAFPVNFVKLTKLLLAWSLLLLGCTDESSIELSDFTSDGCSLFIDGTFEKPALWKECCLTHDIAYWQGGTQEERLEADLAFKACVEKKTGDSTLAKLMYDAVRVGGEPYFPTWYRWGYGWPIGRGYKKLSKQELVMVKQKLSKYWAVQ